MIKIGVKNILYIMLHNSINNSTFGRTERAINADNMVPWWLTLKFRILSSMDSERKSKERRVSYTLALGTPHYSVVLMVLM